MVFSFRYKITAYQRICKIGELDLTIFSSLRVNIVARMVFSELF